MSISYHPGHVCIFRSADLWHKVSRWEPSVDSAVDDPAPGRIGSVSFFPKESFEVLKDKIPGWGPDTDYGRWADFNEE